MNIGELFINLGIKGTEKSKKELIGVKGTLGEVSTAGLAAKAAILAVVYGIEQLASGSNAAGASLMSYAGATGLSAETLQRWQYAARQANVSAEEMENSITGLQSSMIKMAMGQGMPSGFGVIKNAVGIDPDKIRDTMYMMSKLAEYAKTEGNFDFANEQLKSFGLSLDMISAMRRNAFNPTTLSQAPLYSDREAATLAKANAAWRNLQQQIEMGIGHLNAKHGLQFVHDISVLTKEFLKLADVLLKVAERLKIFEGISEVISTIAEAIKVITGGTSSDKGLKPTGQSDLVGDTWGVLKSGFQKTAEFMETQRSSIHKLQPKMDPTTGRVITQTVHNTNVVAHVNEAKDGQDSANHIKRVIDRTGRNRHGQKRAN